MSDIKFEDEDRNFRPCPHCTIQIPADLVKCPHCGMFVPPEEKKSKEGSQIDPIDLVKVRRMERRRRRLRLWGVSLLAIVLAFAGTLMFKKLTGVNVEVVPVEGFEIKDVRVERRDGEKFLVGTLTNNLKDVPLLSLSAIGIHAVVETKDRVFTETVYPVGPLGEPGALYLGEEGTFSLSLPEGGIDKVILTPQLIDLGSRKKFYRPRSR